MTRDTTRARRYHNCEFALSDVIFFLPFEMTSGQTYNKRRIMNVRWNFLQRKFDVQKKTALLRSTRRNSAKREIVITAQSSDRARGSFDFTIHYRSRLYMQRFQRRRISAILFDKFDFGPLQVQFVFKQQNYIRSFLRRSFYKFSR